jgi:glutamate-1-semialdehyde 2,1-aminomutase
VLAYGTHNMSYAHSEADVAHLVGVYDEVFGVIAGALGGSGVRAALRCEPLVPLFKVR